MMNESKEAGLVRFFTESFSKISPSIAKQICNTADINSKTAQTKIPRSDVEKLYYAIQETRFPLPSTDCIVPIGEEQLLKGLHKVVAGQFFTTATRPPAVYRGNPFQIEVGLAYGGAPASHRVSFQVLEEMLSESDARTLRQFLMSTFDGLGMDAADKIIKSARLRPRVSPKNIEPKELTRLHESLQSLNLSEGQTMNVYRYANRVPLQFKAGDCLITQTVQNLNWRPYGLNQTRGQLPRGPVTVIVHLASVSVPFTSESKEAVASYPEIQKELRLALQAVGRKFGMFMKRRDKVKQEAERRSVFLRYLGEVAGAVSSINKFERDALLEMLTDLARQRTMVADVKLGEDGKPVEEEVAEDENDFGKNVIIEDVKE
jgi:DNA topoisomerase-6 subunit B